MVAKTAMCIFRNFILNGSAILLLAAACSRKPGNGVIPAFITDVQKSVDIEATRLWLSNTFGLDKTNVEPQLISVNVENLPNDIRTLVPGATPLRAALEYGPGFSNPNLRVFWGGGFLRDRGVIIGGRDFVFASNPAELTVTNAVPGVYIIY